MKEEDDEVLRIRLGRLVGVLNELPPILKAFLVSKNGVASGGREFLMAFALLERIHYNSKACAPLAEELAYNHHAALPLSHLFRGIIYEVIIGQWVFEKDFTERMDSLNSEYIIKNDKRIRAFKNPRTEDEMQQTYLGWRNFAPNNFNSLKKPNGDEELAINKTIKSVQFKTIQDSLDGKVKDMDSLNASYNVLSQQAHVTEFSREIIYNRYNSLIKLFDLACRPIIATSVLFVNKVGDAVETIAALESLADKFYPDPSKP